mmetsp:Transcript_1178/g.3429  ORF Transcript_1178/g.3429 Transcript_1178/m.3429 type:complete len:222 (-) Transcript_1178:544-1209(-)
MPDIGIRRFACGLVGCDDAAQVRECRRHELRVLCSLVGLPARRVRQVFLAQANHRELEGAVQDGQLRHHAVSAKSVCRVAEQPDPAGGAKGLQHVREAVRGERGGHPDGPLAAAGGRGRVRVPLGELPHPGNLPQGARRGHQPEPNRPRHGCVVLRSARHVPELDPRNGAYARQLGLGIPELHRGCESHRLQQRDRFFPALLLEHRGRQPVLPVALERDAH